MKLRSLGMNLAAAAVLSVAAPHLYAQDGFAGALLRSPLPSASSVGHFGPTIAAADFDSDSKPDGVVLLDAPGFRAKHGVRTIEVHLSGRPNTELSFQSSDAVLAISAQDVNRDGATDIVVEQPLTHRRVQVWLNDGHGDFRQVRSEDFPVPDFIDHQGLDYPSQSPDARVMLLPPRASDTGALSAKSPVLYPRVVAELRLNPVTSLPAPALLSWAPSRAPPLSIFG
jgi:hypothetical protein